MRTVVFQYTIAALPEPGLRVLGGDAISGIFLADAVPVHQPSDPVFSGCCDGYGYLTQLRQTSFKQGNGIDGSQGGVTFQLPQNLCFHRAMGDAVQVRQGFFVGKDDGTQFFSVQRTVFHRSGESAGNGIQQPLVFFQKLVIDGIAVQNQRAPFLQDLEQGGFSAAGAAGNTQGPVGTPPR